MTERIGNSFEKRAERYDNPLTAYIGAYIGDLYWRARLLSEPKTINTPFLAGCDLAIRLLWKFANQPDHDRRLRDRKISFCRRNGG